MIYYPALIERSADGFAIQFPDVPGCVTTGRDTAELMAHAVEALTLHLESLRDDGDELPEPGELYDPLPDWLTDLGEDHFTRTLVPVEIKPAEMAIKSLSRHLPEEFRDSLIEKLFSRSAVDMVQGSHVPTTLGSAAIHNFQLQEPHQPRRSRRRSERTP